MFISCGVRPAAPASLLCASERKGFHIPSPIRARLSFLIVLVGLLTSPPSSTRHALASVLGAPAKLPPPVCFNENGRAHFDLVRREHLSAVLDLMGLAVTADPFTSRPTLRPASITLNSDADWWAGYGPAGVAGVGVHTAAIYQGHLVIGGEFNQCAGLLSSNIACWDGLGWKTIGTGPTPGTTRTVEALAVNGSDLYLAGAFSTVDGQTNVMNGITRWDGNSWHTVGNGTGISDPINHGIKALAYDAATSTLYAGGEFPSIDGVANTAFVAKFSGGVWSALGSGMNGGVLSLALLNGALYAGGEFTNAGGVIANHVAVWTGGSWSPLSDGADNNVDALMANGSNLIVGGAFATVTNHGSPSISSPLVAQWSGSAWSPLGSGISGAGETVYGLGSYGSSIIAVGSFTSASGPNYLAQFDGSSWSSVGPASLDGEARTATAYTVQNASELIVGGFFSSAGGMSLDRVGRWNNATSSWRTLGAGIGWAAPGISPSEQVTAFLPSGTAVYVGGSFSKAGATPAAAIAKWSAGGWSTLGGGLSIGGGQTAYAYSLAPLNGAVIVGGHFDQAGSSPAYNIAKWDPSAGTWAPLGSNSPASGFDNEVRSIVIFGGNLYAGGLFSMTKDQSVTGLNGLARWTGSVWSSVSGWSGGSSVYGLTVLSGKLYATGYNSVWSFDGSSWAEIGIANFTVLALGSTCDGKLVAGGNFQSMSGVAAKRVAAWNGSAWSALGPGLDGEVRGFSAFRSGLIAVGAFTFTGDGVTPMKGVAHWDGSSWSAMTGAPDLGLAAPIWDGIGPRAAVAVDDTLYVGGPFARAGNMASVHIARYTETDVASPGAISDLAVDSADCPTATAVIGWTAPGDDGVCGVASSFVLKVSRNPITAGNFDAAASLSAPTPGAPGTHESVRVSIGFNQSKYFAVKAVDEARDTSAFVNALRVDGPPSPDNCTNRPGLAGMVQPVRLELFPPNPNPAREQVSVRFGVPRTLEGEPMEVSVFDLAGRRVAVLGSGVARAGYHSVNWSLKVAGGRTAARGIYFVRIILRSETASRTLVIMH